MNTPNKDLSLSVIPVTIEHEVSTSYLNYAMSVIVSRALPDVRDGLKPVHRRILYSMNDMGLTAGSQYKKTGRIVGDVLGKYHPHGDQSIYDALVRLAQNFNLRYPVVDGQGNFGSLDGDPPAAMRYTEARLTKLAEEMLRDIKKDTVDFRPNYDDSMQEPSVLPAAFPFLLVNGGSGIAVGMATSLPPHNLREIAAAVAACVKNPDITSEALCRYIQGPDFPTGGVIQGREGILKTYTTGKGKIVMRGTLSIEGADTARGGKRIVIQEIPYLIGKTAILTRIADLVREQKVIGIKNIRDESDRKGMRVVIELKANTDAQVVCKRLYALTQLQSNFNANLLAIVKNRPKLLTLKEIISSFIAHRKEVVIRRTTHDLKVSEERRHILEGLIVAIDNIDEVVKIIRSSKDVMAAHRALRKRFSLSERQVKSILDMRLQKLTNLESNKLRTELKETIALIAYLKDLLAHEEKILDLIVKETRKIAELYGDERRTVILEQESESVDNVELIQPTDVAVLLSHTGYIKRTPLSSYRIQSRGGRGSGSSIGVEKDWVQIIRVGSTIDYLFLLSDAGKCYVLRINNIDDLSRAARGKHLRGIISMNEREHISEALIIKSFSDKHSILFATKAGILKRTLVNEYAHVKTRGIVGIKLDRHDVLRSASLVEGTEQVILVSAHGQGLCIGSRAVRLMGRASRGIQGMRLENGDSLIAARAVTPHSYLLVVSEGGFAKRMQFGELQQHSRGTKGQRVYASTRQSGMLVAALIVRSDWRLFMVSSSGNTTVIPVSEIPIQSRTARGVRCMQVNKDERVVAAGVTNLKR